MVMGVAFFFGVFLLVLSEDADGDWSACRNLHLLPNVQAPFCHFQQILLLDPADEGLLPLFPLDESLLPLPAFLTFHLGIIDFLGMTVKTFVTFVTPTFVEEVVAKNLLLING